MPITKAIKTPGGADIAYHVATRVEAQTLDAAQVLLVQVSSWPSVEAYDLAGGKAATWNDWHPVDFAAMANSAALGLGPACEQALAASPNSSLAGGIVSAMRDGLDGARARQWANIKQQRELLDNSPIDHDGYQVDAGASSRLDIMGAVMAMQAGGQASRLWRCSDNVMRELLLADLLAIGQAIAARRQALIETSDTLYQQLNAATDATAVAAVVWPTSPSA